MPSTYEPIATITLTTASTNTVTFSSIPQTYTDLRLVQIAMQTTSHNDTRARVSGLLTTYGVARINRDATNVDATNAIVDTNGFWTNQNSIDAENSTGFFSGTICDIFDYTSTSRAKVAYSRIFSADNNQVPQVTVSIRTQTDAVTSLECLINSTPLFSAGSTFTLYGIKAA
jgi:hypothetical protein